MIYLLTVILYFFQQDYAAKQIIDRCAKFIGDTDKVKTLTIKSRLKRGQETLEKVTYYQMPDKKLEITYQNGRETQRIYSTPHEAQIIFTSQKGKKADGVPDKRVARYLFWHDHPFLEKNVTKYGMKAQVNHQLSNDVGVMVEYYLNDGINKEFAVLYDKKVGYRLGIWHYSSIALAGIDLGRGEGMYRAELGEAKQIEDIYFPSKLYGFVGEKYNSVIENYSIKVNSKLTDPWFLEK